MSIYESILDHCRHLEEGTLRCGDCLRGIAGADPWLGCARCGKFLCVGCVLTLVVKRTTVCAVCVKPGEAAIPIRCAS